MFCSFSTSADGESFVVGLQLLKTMLISYFSAIQSGIVQVCVGPSKTSGMFVCLILGETSVPLGTPQCSRATDSQALVLATRDSNALFDVLDLCGILSLVFSTLNYKRSSLRLDWTSVI